MGTALIKASKGELVADELEKRINNGKIPLGRKIPTNRELAIEFNVSRQVIQSAFNLLEERHLIVRRPRSGTYVNPDSVNTGKMDIGLLRMKFNDIPDYCEQLLSMNNIAIWQSCNLSIRSVPYENYSLGILKYEVEKLRRSHLDCLIVFLPWMKLEELEVFRDLPFPVIFLGDILPENSDPKEWNQISEETSDRIETMLDVAADYDYSHAALICGSLEDSYCRQMKEAGTAYAAKLGIDFRYVELEDNKALDDKTKSRIRHAAIREALDDKTVPVAIMTDGYIKVNMFMQAIKKEGAVLHRDTDLIVHGELFPDTIFLHTDYSEISKEILKITRKIIAKPHNPLGKVIISGKIKREALRINWELKN